MTPDPSPPALLYHGDCREWLPKIASGSVDAVICDPPYPCVDREYGRMTEADWHEMMRIVVAESRRILKPSGSAVFILQPNSERVGRIRPWLWEFMAWTAREWNQVQDAWWWNVSAPPTVHCHRDRGLMRPSVKACVWLGAEDCARNQSDVLWSESEANAAQRGASRLLKYKPSGLSMRAGRCTAAASERGGVTPFNLLPIANTNSTNSAGSNGHGAGTPQPLCDWWVRYISPIGGIILDPFMGSGTVLISALNLRRQAIGIEKHESYFRMAKRRIERPHVVGGRKKQEESVPPLFSGLDV